MDFDKQPGPILFCELPLEGGQRPHAAQLFLHCLPAGVPFAGSDEFRTMLADELVRFEPKKCAFGAVHTHDRTLEVDLMAGDGHRLKQVFVVECGGRHRRHVHINL